MSGNEKLIASARRVWEAFCAPNWNQDSLVALGKLIFAKQNWEKLDKDIKLLFLRAAVVARQDDTNGKAKETAGEGDITKPETPAAKEQPKQESKKEKKQEKQEKKEEKQEGAA